MKPRLFVFGDSYAFNYFSNQKPKYRPELEKYKFLSCKPAEIFVKRYECVGHWTDYIENHFDVINYAEPGCSNEDIIHQLGFLPEYSEGDRMVIVFSNVGRYTWFMSDFERHAITNGSSWQLRNEKKITDFADEQIVLRDYAWDETSERENEKLFYEKLSIIYKNFNPIKVTWDDLMSKHVQSILLIPYKTENWTSIRQESNGTLNDGHLGFVGNYKFYVWIADLLNVEKEKIVPILNKPNVI
jgi:hypothetical protein